jgi:6-phosphogluconolactonase (cycloisomerase 2 family)
MKMGKWALFLLLVAPFLSGCSGFWDASADDTTTSTTLSSGYFFLLDSSTSTILSYYISSGTLTLASTTALPATPLALTVAPNGDFLYVSTTSGIYVYTISSGTLTLGNSSSSLTDDEAATMAVDVNDSWLLESSGTYLYAIPISSSTGAYDSSRSTQSITLPGSTIYQLAFSANDGYLFAALGTNGTYEWPFTYSSSSSPVGSSSKIALTGASALSVAVDPSDRMVYIGETNAVSSSGGLRAFTFTASTGALSEISSSPISSGGTGPYFILPKSTLDYVYVANWTGESTAGKITGFEITATTSSYTLSKVSSISTGIRPMALAEDSNKDFVLAANAGGSPYFDAYVFDSSTAGQLDNVATSSSYAAISVAAVP